MYMTTVHFFAIALVRGATHGYDISYHCLESSPKKGRQKRCKHWFIFTKKRAYKKYTHTICVHAPLVLYVDRVLVSNMDADWRLARGCPSGSLGVHTTTRARYALRGNTIYTIPISTYRHLQLPPDLPYSPHHCPRATGIQ